ncbi:MAG TPA: hypothetical protein VNZ55_12350 [Thermomicrobiales bacterium]|nr:hypothetical protein [Thermomicrobiales bacterium]
MSVRETFNTMGPWSSRPRYALAGSMTLVLTLVLGYMTPGPLSASTLPPASAWMPSTITVETGEIEPGTRFVRTTMSWDDVSGFGSNSTFELDFLLDNYDASPLGPGTYLDRSRAFDQTPAVKHWESNLPAAYLDTRFGDGKDEIAYSVGSGNAREIEAGREYVTLIVTASGDTDRDSARLSVQLGHQRPAGCTSTWCSFDDGPGSIVEIFPAWAIPVPGVATCGNAPGTPVAGNDGDSHMIWEESCQPGTT